MIDAMGNDSLEFEIRKHGKSGELEIRDFGQYFHEEGKRSVLAIQNQSADFTLRNYLSKAGLEVQSIEESGNITRIKCKERTNIDIDFKTSIVMSSYGHPRECALAIDSIRKNTSIPFELIVSDNPHPDESQNPREMLKRAEADGKIDHLIFNEKNLGDMGALNSGISVATGKHICVANNDIIATNGWLNAMVQCAEQEEDAGIVSGRTNNITGIQQVNRAPSNEFVDSNLALLYEYSPLWMSQHYLGWWKYPRIRSFVMLVTKRLLDRGGKLDEIYGMGNYDDDDICMQAHSNGLGVYIADDSYVHHYGSLSFKENMETFKDSLIENRKKFLKKWEIHSSMAELIIAQDISKPPIVQDVLTWRVR